MCGPGLGEEAGIECVILIAVRTVFTVCPASDCGGILILDDDEIKESFQI